tara:strand:- start:288 stop:638 length:351 start_codon:yes stop_codon:yes gene_type:complete
MKHIEMEERPWGRFFVIHEEPTYKLKRIEVAPDQRLSYQYHNERSESWTIVEGRGILTINGLDTDIGKGDTITIEKKDKHRIQNTGDDLLVFIEVQTGSYFGEDDIVRIQDDYKRI